DLRRRPVLLLQRTGRQGRACRGVAGRLQAERSIRAAPAVHAAQAKRQVVDPPGGLRCPALPPRSGLAVLLRRPEQEVTRSSAAAGSRDATTIVCLEDLRLGLRRSIPRESPCGHNDL